jgi:acid phosphatase type 7
MLKIFLLSSLLASALGVCQEVKTKLKELHIDVLASIEARFGAPPTNSTPQQLHLSLTGKPNELFVTWVVEDAGDVCADSHASVGAATFPAQWSTYEAGVAGWSGHVYTARMTNLVGPFEYSVTSCGQTTGPVAAAAPKPTGPDQSTLVAVMADMGTVIPLGFATAEQIEKDSRESPFDLFVLAGDIAYATVDPPKNEFEEVWSAYGRMIEPFVSHAPFMPNVGNHEHTPGTMTTTSGTIKVDYAAFQTRYSAVPPNGNSSLWYSYDHGSVHYTYINSEEDQSPGSPQAQWLAADLAAADANRAQVPWIIMMQHRPVYSSTKSEINSHSPHMGFALVLEPYIGKYKVDLFITGHQHQYERTHAVFNGTVLSTGNGNATYVKPGAPLYVVQGTSGAFVAGDWADPQPAWSAYREGTSYGYGKMLVEGSSRMVYQWISIAGEVLDHFEIIKQ